MLSKNPSVHLGVTMTATNPCTTLETPRAIFEEAGGAE